MKNGNISLTHVQNDFYEICDFSTPEIEYFQEIWASRNFDNVLFVEVEYQSDKGKQKLSYTQFLKVGDNCRHLANDIHETVPMDSTMTFHFYDNHWKKYWTSNAINDSLKTVKEVIGHAMVRYDKKRSDMSLYIGSLTDIRGFVGPFSV